MFDGQTRLRLYSLATDPSALFSACLSDSRPVDIKYSSTMNAVFSCAILTFAVTGRAALAFVSPSHIGISKVVMRSASGSSDAKDNARSIVVVGGGIQGTSCAFHLHQSSYLPPGSTITILESQKLASAASGKGGGFMARSWGDGTDTQKLHELAFDMYETLSRELHVESYRKLPVISVAPGPQSNGKQDNKKKHPQLADIIPNWLDGSVGRLSPMGWGDDTAQVTPKEFVDKMMEYVNQPGKAPGVNIVIGTCIGIESAENDDGVKVVTGVKYINGQEEMIMKADEVIVAAGPWACQAEQWLDNAVKLPMEGIKSTSIVWKPPLDDEGNVNLDDVEATALFCGEDSRFGTHREFREQLIYVDKPLPTSNQNRFASVHPIFSRGISSS